MSVLFFAFASGFSQNLRLDSLTQQLTKDSLYIYRFREIRPYLNYHERNSLFNPKTVNFKGLQLGAVLFEKHIIGVGYYVSSRFTKKPFERYEDGNVITQRINIDYGSLFYQYILLNHRFFEVHLPGEVAFGNNRITVEPHNNGAARRYREDVFITSTGAQLILKPVRWCGLSTNLGYRVSTEQLVTGAYYAVGFWVGFKPVINDVNYYLLKKRRFKKAVKNLLKN